MAVGSKCNAEIPDDQDICPECESVVPAELGLIDLEQPQPPDILSETDGKDDAPAVESPPRETTQTNRTGSSGKRTALKSLPEGTTLNGRYSIIRKIGGGGMGAVYLASDKNLNGVERAVKEMVQSSIEEEQQTK